MRKRYSRKRGAIFFLIGCLIGVLVAVVFHVNGW
jgi:hypothetical protein